MIYVQRFEFIAVVIKTERKYILNDCSISVSSTFIHKKNPDLLTLVAMNQNEQKTFSGF